MAIGYFDIYDGEGRCYVIKQEPAIRVYDDGVMTYFFNKHDDVVGFLFFYNEDTQKNIDKWFKTLTARHLGLSEFSFVQRVIFNQSNLYNPSEKLLVELYNKNIDKMKWV